MAEGQGRSSGQGVKLLYIRDYLYAHATKEHPKNAKHIVDYLASKGISASVKTIYNDILRLQIDFGVPVEYNPQKWGYYITEPQFEPYELRLLVDSVQSAKFLTDKMAAQLSEKIKGLADVYTKDSLNRQAYVSNRVRNMNEAAVEALGRIYEAISKDRKIKVQLMDYTPGKNNRKQSTLRNPSGPSVASPYLVAWTGEYHILYAYFEIEGEPRIGNVAIDVIGRVEILDEPREGKEYIKQRGLFDRKPRSFAEKRLNKDPVMVRLLVHNDSVVNVFDRFGQDLIMIPYDDTHFTVTVPIDLTPEFLGWAVQHIGRIQVLNPERAVQMIRMLASVIFHIYGATDEDIEMLRGFVAQVDRKRKQAP